MKATPKFNGIWYGHDCQSGETREFPDELKDKISARSDLFAKTRKRKAKDADENES